ncbi:hypothetical protein K466DRAFT_239960 [Polyporus arcularius HHB13444]|uniref:Uncharacterized protein n=1 Tax=Polyporus arcularius HHB13444 TaxID=1314778 RepID=A0A5C3P6X2_9APHY|nr:hypothetical protein K466DRAFT_239960 [Polyporus arcularius HHB13444]
MDANWRAPGLAGPCGWLPSTDIPSTASPPHPALPQYTFATYAVRVHVHVTNDQGAINRPLAYCALRSLRVRRGLGRTPHRHSHPGPQPSWRAAAHSDIIDSGMHAGWAHGLPFVLCNVHGHLPDCLLVAFGTISKAQVVGTSHASCAQYGHANK